MSRREVNDLLDEVRRLGWTIKSGRHWKLIPPDGGPFVICPKTPSDHRSIPNARAQVRRNMRGHRDCAIHM